MPRGSVSPGRRGVLLGALGAGVFAVAGCGIRLQDDAPDVPFVPRRTPIGAEAELLSLLANCRELAAACTRWVSGPQVALAPGLTAIHRQQADVLAALLADAHVPADLVTGAAPSSTAGPGTGSTAPASGTPTVGTATSAPVPTPGAAPATTSDVARLEAAPLARAPGLAAAPAPLLPTVTALLAQRYAAVSVVGGTAPHLGATGATGRPTTAPTAAPTAAGRWPEPDLLAVLAATRAAVYGFEVVAAQADRAGRALGLHTITTLAVLESEQVAALVAVPPPAAIGYPLPFPVTTPALARRLARRLAGDLSAAYGSRLGAVSHGQEPFTDLVQWLGQVEVVGHGWGGTLVPFPGMTTP